MATSDFSEKPIEALHADLRDGRITALEARIFAEHNPE